MPDTNAFLQYKTKGPVKLNCEVDLDRLLPTQPERRRFDSNWESFLASDSSNKKIFHLRKHILQYESEQLIPAIIDKRPPLLLVLGNPASHSVHAGMFFAFEGNRKEHRFWKNILKPVGLLQLPELRKGSVDKMNRLRREQLRNLKYKGPFRIGLCVFISMPSAPSGKWGGVAGVQRLIGVRALRRLEIEETRRIQELADKFIGNNGGMVIFQKNAWNALRSKKDPEYSIDSAKKGLLGGRLKNASWIKLLGVPPTRLSGPCRRVLGQLKERKKLSGNIYQ